MKISEFLAYFEGVRGSGPRWMARCPAHVDDRPSLSVSAVDGRILIHCFAGCDAGEVLESAGLSWEDLVTGDIDE
jgi:putative DNA primase/helicase